MILKTVDDVSHQVDRIPIREVFNWDRVKWQYGLLVALSVVLFFGAMAGDFIAHRSTNPVHFATGNGIGRASGSSETSGLGYPLAAAGVPGAGRFPGLGRPADRPRRPSPRIRARALKWVTVDPAVPGGWRALTWADLTPKLLGDRPVPPLPRRAAGRPGAQAKNAPGRPTRTGRWTAWKHCWTRRGPRAGC